MTEIEKKNVLNLFPYFSKNPIVFDVGSNKGMWSDAVVNNVSELHLFEPNEILLHYTMAKYDCLPNVIYNEVALGNQKGTTEFTYFINENNGLSNIIGNPKWDYLPWKKKKVKATTLDLYWKGRTENIDFLKIDVEGAELMVLNGAYQLLIDKRFKFIQVENAEHIKVTGRSFDNILIFLRQLGYVPMTENLNQENIIFMQEGFTQDWNGEFKKNTQGMKFDFALEIGVFEGLTSRYICENLLNPGGRMIAVDPLTDEYLPGHEDNAMFVGQFERFTRNTRGYPVELMRMKSIEAFPLLHDYRFDFIYVDGDHTRDAVYMDAVNAFKICKVGGYILFDDYEWRTETKEGIDRFLNSLPTNKMTVVLKGYQVMVKKHENLD